MQRPRSVTRWPSSCNPATCLRSMDLPTPARLGMEDQSTRAMEQYQKLQAESWPLQRDARDGAVDVVNCRRDLAMTCCDAGAVYIANGMPEKAESLLRRSGRGGPGRHGLPHPTRGVALQRQSGARDRSRRSGTDRYRVQDLDARQVPGRPNRDQAGSGAVTGEPRFKQSVAALERRYQGGRSRHATFIDLPCQRP